MLNIVISNQITINSLFVILFQFNLFQIILLSPSSIQDPILSTSQDSRCLNCIRNITNIMNIDSTKRCEGYFCGPFQISYTYWAEAGKPGNNLSSRDYEKCVRDKSCAEQTVRAYFKKFKRDCNNDGSIDCLDMAALHKGGPTSCSSDWFYKSRYWLAFNKTDCMINRDNLNDGSSKYDFNGNNNNSDFDKSNLGQTVRLMKNQSLTTECLDCICDAVSGCNTSVNNCGSGTVCGPFAISQAYWKDGRKPGASWTACTRTKECSSVTMKNYMEKYKKDCNGDGVINCEDYAAIHRRGPRACSNKDLLKDHYWNKFLSCRANQSPTKDVNLVKVNEDEPSLSQASNLASRGDTSTSNSNTLPLVTIDQQQQQQHHQQSSVTTQSTTVAINDNKYEFSQTPSYELRPANEKDDKRFTGSRPSDHSHHHHHNIYQNQQHHQQSTVTTVTPTAQSVQPAKQADIKDISTKRPDPDFSHNRGHPAPVSPILPHNVHEEPTIQLKPSSEYEDVPIILVKQPSPPFRSTSAPSTVATTVATTSSPSTVASISSNTNHNSPDTNLHITGSHHEDSIKPQEQIVPQISLQPIPNFSPLDQTMSQPVAGGEIDFTAPDFPFSPQNSGSDRPSSFDNAVINIVRSPDFSKSYPPIPDINIQDQNKVEQPSQTANDLQSHLASKSQQKVNTNHSKSPNQANNKPAPPSTSSYHTSDLQTQKNPVMNDNSNRKVSPESSNQIYNQRSAINQQQQQQKQQHPNHNQETKNVENSNNNQPNLTPISGPDSLNISSLFMKGLNESSRIASECLECICDASSNCDTTVQCISKQREKNRCGPYMISWNQYQESDISLTSLVSIPAGMSEETMDEKMYYECTTDRTCAEKLIHLYIEKHQMDCNRDGKIDCYDIAAIHRVGPENCNSGKFLSSQYWKDFNICYSTDGPTTTVQPQVLSQLPR